MNVTNAAELTAAIQNAKAGDEIVLAAGTYALTNNVTCEANGTAAAPIVVRAASPLTARIDSSALEGFVVTGAYWRFEGLDVHGVCALDKNCEHAFHVKGAANGFVLRGNRIVDFNAQIKVNANLVSVGNATIPNAGLIEYNELFDTHPRDTGTPVTKVNIDTGDDWVVRGNYIHDFHSAAGNTVVTYGAFMKSGGHRGVFERNLVTCAKDVSSTTTMVGLSFGGGGTANQYCAPAFDANVTCAVEHEDGIARNNIVTKCSDVGVYVNRGKNTRVLFNTLVATAGIDFRFDTTSGEARGNVLAGAVQNREASTATFADNLVRTQNDFDAMYMGPLVGDLRLKGDVSALVGKSGAVNGVTDDYCGRMRGAAPLDFGALESSLGDCTTVPPPVVGPSSSSSSSSSSGGADASVGPNGDAGSSGSASSSGAPETKSLDDDQLDDGCGCRTTPARVTGFAAWLGAAIVVLALRRRR